MSKIKFAASALITLSALSAASALANSNTSMMTSHEALSETYRNPRRIDIFGGVAAGYAHLKTSELSKANGRQINLSLLGSAYYDQWVTDLGVGWSSNKVTGMNPAQSTIAITTDAAYAELSPRYRLTDRWQLGPVLNYEFATGLDFNAVKPNDKFSNLLLAGAKVVYEMPTRSLDLRFVGKPEISLNLPAERRLYLMVVGVEIGLPLSKKPSLPAAAAADQIQAQQASPTRHSYDVLLNPVHFATNSAKLDEASRAYLLKLGQIMAANKDAWNSALITGHTDIRGSKKLNQSLSEKRAQSVIAALREGGLMEERLSGKGEADTRPIDSAQNFKAYKKNRRTELVFQIETNSKELSEQIKALNVN